MDNISIYFFWPGLVISILFSILLTVGLNLWARKKRASGESYDFEEDGRNAFNDKTFRETGHDFEEAGEVDEAGEMDEAGEVDEANGANEPRSKMSGMIMIGPIPILFGSGGVRFDKKAFKYALLVFIIIILIWWIMVRTVRL